MELIKAGGRREIAEDLEKKERWWSKEEKEKFPEKSRTMQRRKEERRTSNEDERRDVRKQKIQYRVRDWRKKQRAINEDRTSKEAKWDKLP